MMASITPVPFRHPFETVPNDNTPESIKDVCRAFERLNGNSSSHHSTNNNVDNEYKSDEENTNDTEQKQQILPHIVDTSLQSPLNARCMSSKQRLIDNFSFHLLILVVVSHI